MNASAKAQHKNVRQLASEILLKVDTQKAYADILLDHALKVAAFDERDRALLTEVVYGTLRWRGSIDAKLSLQMRRPLTQADPFLRNLLRATLYQVIFLDKIPDYAAVNEAVELAKLRGVRAAGFVNGVLRNVLRHNKVAEAAPSDQSSGALAEQLSHPEWLVKRWLNDFGIARSNTIDAREQSESAVDRSHECAQVYQGKVTRAFSNSRYRCQTNPVVATRNFSSLRFECC